MMDLTGADLYYMNDFLSNAVEVVGVLDAVVDVELVPSCFFPFSIHGKQIS